MNNPSLLRSPMTISFCVFSFEYYGDDGSGDGRGDGGGGSGGSGSGGGGSGGGVVVVVLGVRFWQ